jgi:CubicO group peptidase (beta-lactamase class C family)
MLLVRDGQLSLDESITRFLPHAAAVWRAITIRHLLTHTGGLPRNEPGFQRQQIQRDVDVIRSAYATRLLFPPGTKWLYSNVGYRILGQAFNREQVTNR